MDYTQLEQLLTASKWLEADRVTYVMVRLATGWKKPRRNPIQLFHQSSFEPCSSALVGQVEYPSRVA